MEENKRRWADDDPDEDWDQPDHPTPQAPAAPPKSLPSAPRRDYSARLAGMSPPYLLEIGNLPFDLDSPERILPYLTAGFPTPSLNFRPFSEFPRGNVGIETSDLTLAQHIANLDGTAETGRTLHVYIGFGTARRGGNRGGRGDRGDRGGRGDKGGRRGGRDHPVQQEQPKGGRPRGSTYPGVVQNQNTAYSRKEAPQPEIKAEVEQQPAVISPPK